MRRNRCGFHSGLSGAPLHAVIALAALLSTSIATAQDDDDSGFKYLEVKVLDLDGKPLAGANVEVSMDGAEFPLMTDDEGIVSFNVPSKLDRSLSVAVREDGFAAIGVRWNRGAKVPDEFTIPLQKGTSIGGIVHDEEGKPIEGVEIKASFSSVNRKAGELYPISSGKLPTSDNKGHWQIDSAHSESAAVSLKMAHDDYVQEETEEKYFVDQLKSLDTVFILRKGGKPFGKVFDTEGNPVTQARVFLENSSGSIGSQETTTNQSGEYAFHKAMLGNTLVTVTADNFAPELQSVTVTPEMQPISFHLKPGNTIRIHLVDLDGNPVKEGLVRPIEWNGHEVLKQPWWAKPIRPWAKNTKANDQGIWAWNEAPEGPVKYNFHAIGYLSVLHKELTPQEEDYVVVLRKSLAVQGRVADAETGLRIRQFDIVRGFRQDLRERIINWDSSKMRVTTNGGTYSADFGSPRFSLLLRIEAKGYLPSISREIKPGENNVTIDFMLKRDSGRNQNDPPAVQED